MGQSLSGGRTTKSFCGDLKTRLGFGICPDSTEEPLNALNKGGYVMQLLPREDSLFREKGVEMQAFGTKELT